METSNGNGINWPEAVWKEINEGVVKEVNKVRVAQKVFPPTSFDNNLDFIPNEVINFTDLSIKPGDTKTMVEIYAEFSLTHPQVTHEAD